MKAYMDFADVYDELMDDVPYEEWCEEIDCLIHKYGISRPEGRSGEEAGQALSEEEKCLKMERNLVLDLGCGTGNMTHLLYQKGYDMIGIDSSERMLELAAAKREANGEDILYLQQDMRQLDLYSTIGTVVSVCDCMNYILEEEELLGVFSLVRNYLYPGGIFIFDFNTVYKYEVVMGNSTIAENREDCSFIWENYYDPETFLNEYDLTVFVRQEEEELFRKFEETHIQRGYTLEQIAGLLKKAGLQILEAKDCDTGMYYPAEDNRAGNGSSQETAEEDAEETVAEGAERIRIVCKKSESDAVNGIQNRSFFQC